jgi:hypothetical protein
MSQHDVLQKAVSTQHHSPGISCLVVAIKTAIAPVEREKKKFVLRSCQPAMFLLEHV